MKKIIILILFSVFFISSCSTSSSTRSESDIFTGINGLAIEFAKNAPPLTVFEQSSFPILLKIKNTGAYSINPSMTQDKKVLLSIGREKDYIPKLTFERNSRINVVTGKNIDHQAFFYLDGKSLLNSKGDEIVVYLNADTGRLEPQSEQKNSYMTANICYPYKTTLATTICIDPDVIGIRPGQKVCQVKDITFSSGQGAPIAITVVQEQMIPKFDTHEVKPQFLIFIENKGSGNPVDTASYQNVCGKADLQSQQSADQKNNVWNVAYVKAFASGNEQLVCCPSKDGECKEDSNNPNDWMAFVRFRDNKDFVRCIFRNGIPENSESYLSPLRVEVDYGYVQTVSASFIIQKPLTH